jgi:hypothetical protein
VCARARACSLISRWLATDQPWRAATCSRLACRTASSTRVFPVGVNPNGVAVDPGSGTMSVIDGATNTVIQSMFAAVALTALVLGSLDVGGVISPDRYGNRRPRLTDWRNVMSRQTRICGLWAAVLAVALLSVPTAASAVPTTPSASNGFRASLTEDYVRLGCSVPVDPNAYDTCGTADTNRGAASLTTVITRFDFIGVDAGRFCFADSHTTVLTFDRNNPGTVSFDISGTLCATDGSHFTFSGMYEVTGGTGKYKTARGSGEVSAARQGGPIEGQLTGSLHN